MMRVLMITFLSVTFLLSGYPAWLLSPDVPNLCKACSYSFFHANIFHLMANCLSIWFVFKGNTKKNCNDLLVGYLIATLTFFTATRPVVGISNILFAILGLRTPSLKSGWWRSKGTKVFFIVTFAMILVPQFSAITHITSFIVGTLIAMTRRTINTLEEDYGHAIGR